MDAGTRNNLLSSSLTPVLLSHRNLSLSEIVPPSQTLSPFASISDIIIIDHHHKVTVGVTRPKGPCYTVKIAGGSNFCNDFGHRTKITIRGISQERVGCAMMWI